MVTLQTQILKINGLLQNFQTTCTSNKKHYDAVMVGTNTMLLDNPH